MKILTRYVLREFCVPLFYCLTGFVSIYLLFELFGSFSRLSAARPGWGKACAYLAGYLAPYVMWMAPACLMLATLYTMWNFCRHSELIAMRANGIGFFTIVKPILFVAALMACAVGAINELYVPRYGEWAKKFRAARFREDEMAISEKVDYRNTLGRRLWKVGLVVNADATVLEDVLVRTFYPEDAAAGVSANRVKMLVHAARAEYLDGVWWFQNPEISYFDVSGEKTPSPQPELDRLSFRPFMELDERPQDLLLQNRDWAFSSTQERLRYLETCTSLSEEERRSHDYDIWFQVVSPLACLVITLFAIPAGIATGRQSVFKGILGALGMFFAFYALTIVFMVLAKKGWCPPLPAALVPDVVFFGIGCWLFWRHR